MMDYYQQIRDLDFQKTNLAVTVIEGTGRGEKGLFSNGELCALFPPVIGDKIPGDSILAENVERLHGLTGTGILEIHERRIFYEQLSGPRKLVICGAGHVSLPMIRIGKMLGYHITVLDDRPSFVSKAKISGADEAVCGSFEATLDRIPGDKDTGFVIVTRGHRYDVSCLEKILKKPHIYVGMMASRRRAEMVRAEMMERGFMEEELAEVHMPVGLKIASETPEEIAVSVMAEIIQTYNSKERSYGYPEELLGKIIRPAVLATIISKRGAAPREAGTKMLIRRDGSTAGTLGGGCAEAEIVTAAGRMLRGITEPFKIVTVDMTASAAEEEEMVCGGIMEVFLEILP